MILTFRPIKVWPPGWKDVGRNRVVSHFRARYSDTLERLDRELRALNATDVSLQVDASPRDVRLDGQLRADARVDHPGAILTIESRRLGTLTYSCDRFVRPVYRRDSGPSWQHNLRAIALGLEALRTVDRYGIADRDQQYAGYREIGSGATPMGPPTVEGAARFIAETVDPGWLVDVENDPFFALSIFRDAAKLAHPDAGGDPEVFKRLTAARDVLLAAQRETP